MIGLLRRVLPRRHDHATEAWIAEKRSQHASALREQRASARTIRVLRSAGVDYPSLNEAAFGRPPWSERKGGRT